MDAGAFEGKGQHQPLGGPAGSVAGGGGGGGSRSSKNALHHTPFRKQVRVLGDDNEADDDQNTSAGGGMGNLVAKAFTALKRSFSGDAQDAMEPSSSCDAVGKKGYGTDPSSELEQDMQSVMQNAAMAVLHTTKACKDPPPHLHAPELYHPEQVTSYAEMPYWGKANKDNNNAHEGAKNLDVGAMMKSMIEATEAMKSDPGDFATAEEFYQQQHQQQHHQESNNTNDEGEGGVVVEEQHFQQEILPLTAVGEEEKEKDRVFQMPRKNSLDNAMMGGGGVGEEGEMNNTLLREVEVEEEEHEVVVDDARAMEQAAEELAAKEEEALERLEEAVMMFSSD